MKETEGCLRGMYRNERSIYISQFLESHGGNNLSLKNNVKIKMDVRVL